MRGGGPAGPARPARSEQGAGTGGTEAAKRTRGTLGGRGRADGAQGAGGWGWAKPESAVTGPSQHRERHLQYCDGHARRPRVLGFPGQSNHYADRLAPTKQY